MTREEFNNLKVGDKIRIDKEGLLGSGYEKGSIAEVAINESCGIIHTTERRFFSDLYCEHLTLVSDDDTGARGRNVGSSNYSDFAIQPWDIWKEYNLNPWDADIVKRVLRTKKVEGMTSEEARIQDYEKIIHICQYRIDQLKNK